MVETCLPPERHLLSILLFTMTSFWACRGFIAKESSRCSPLSSRHVCVAKLGISATASQSRAFPGVVVKRTRQSRSFRDGNPLVFPGAIAFTYSAKEKQGIDLGALVSVEAQLDKTKGVKKTDDYRHFDSLPKDRTQFIGWGVYNPHSMYRVRILCHATTHPALVDQVKSCHDENEALVRIVLHRLKSAIASRRALSLPCPETDTYRIVNGEGDGLSGLAVDVLGGQVAVVMSSAAWCEIHRDVIEKSLRQALRDHPSYSHVDLDIVWKTTQERLKQDGYKNAIATSDNEQQHDDTKVVVTTESGIRYNSLPYEAGQKTGVYCDQRENRWNLAPLCRGKRVLDLCCYHGGFSLNALIHGHADHVAGVDSSQDAIDASVANAALNDCSKGRFSFIRADISSFMKEAHLNGTEWDVLVLDPPKLAPSVSGLDRATRKYHSLNRDALKLVSASNGGLLLTCTCSAAMTQKDGGQHFLKIVQQAAISAGRSITLLRVSGAAPCHTQTPASYPAGAYLTAALFHVSPIPETTTGLT